METRERLPPKEEKMMESKDGTGNGDVHQTDDQNGKVNMKRQVSLVSGIALIVGTMIGSGIFVSPKGVLRQTESVGMSLIIWMLCGVLSTIGALCYAELGTLIPKSGGEYSYLLDTFGSPFAFLFAWVSTLLVRPSSVAIISLSFAEYVVVPFFDGECGPPQATIKLVGAVCVRCLCYAELGTMIPKSGAEYVYLKEGLHPVCGFLFSYVSTIILKPVQVSAIAFSFGLYTTQPFFDVECGAPTVLVKLTAILAILLIVFINCASVKWATNVQNVFTAAKLLALAIIIVVGFIELGKGNTQYLDPRVSFQGSATNVAAYGIAFYQGLWAYDGWNQLNYVTEELVNPYRNLPLAIIIGIPMVTILYLMVNISYFTVMSPEELLQSGAVAVTFSERTLGVMAWIMPAAVASSTFGAANGTLFTAGRTWFVAARYVLNMNREMWTVWGGLCGVTKLSNRSYLGQCVMAGTSICGLFHLWFQSRYHVYSRKTFADRTLGVMAWCIPFFVACSTFGAANGSLFATGRRLVIEGLVSCHGMSWLIPFFVCCSTYGSANGTVFTAGRLTYVAAREGHMIEVLSMIHVKRLTPFPAMIFTSILAIAMLIPSDFDTLVNYFSFAAWMFYGMTVSALLFLRYKHPEWKRPIKVPLILPIIVLIASIYLIIAPIIEEPALEFLYAFLFILSGLIFYIPFVYYKKELSFMKHITVFFQMLFEVAPTRYIAPEEDENEIKREDEKAIIS